MTPESDWLWWDDGIDFRSRSPEEMRIIMSRQKALCEEGKHLFKKIEESHKAIKKIPVWQYMLMPVLTAVTICNNMFRINENCSRIHEIYKHITGSQE